MRKVLIWLILKNLYFKDPKVYIRLLKWFRRTILNFHAQVMVNTINGTLTDVQAQKTETGHEKRIRRPGRLGTLFTNIGSLIFFFFYNMHQHLGTQY